VVDIEVQIKDIDALETACRRNGWTLHRGQTEHKWYGQWVDDSPLPRGMFATEEEYERVRNMSSTERRDFMTALLSKPANVISVPDNDYQIGVYRVGDAWRLSYDSWLGEINTGHLTQLYAVEAAKNVAHAQGQSFEETVEQDGSILLKVSVNEGGW
jgi:hypothetical protein